MQVPSKSRAYLTAGAVVLAAAIAACSTTKSTGPASVGITAGDTVNLSGTYNLSSFTGQTVDSADGSSIVLTKTTFKIVSSGVFDCMLGQDSGTYVAVDTASASGVVAGTLVLRSLVNVGDSTQGAFVTSGDSLQVIVSNGGSATSTVWIKQ